LISVCIRHTFI